jgi:glycosyltransferase involved in cell wall biosynthesis
MNVQPIHNRTVSSRRLSVMFMVSTLDYGGAETLLDNLARRLDRDRFSIGVCCTKTRGPLGERLAKEVPVYEYQMRRKWDVRIIRWLKARLLEHGADIVVTVGAGDKMFWGRLAARGANVPIVISALHTTGWPDAIGRLNRLLTPVNDAFVGVAKSHRQYLIQTEKLPMDKVHVISNGIDTDMFRPREANRELRDSLRIPAGAPVAGIVARLGEEKNHEFFLRVAHRVRTELPTAHFLIVGDGPRRRHLEDLAGKMKIADCVHFTGARADVDELLALMDVFLLTSYIEANPVSLLEAMSTGIPVVSTNVGSIPETVINGQVGYLVPSGDEDAMTRRVVQLLENSDLCKSLGRAGRHHVVHCWSLEKMVRSYEQLMLRLWSAKVGKSGLRKDPTSPCVSSAVWNPTAGTNCRGE